MKTRMLFHTTWFFEHYNRLPLSSSCYTWSLTHWLWAKNNNSAWIIFRSLLKLLRKAVVLTMTIHAAGVHCEMFTSVVWWPNWVYACRSFRSKTTCSCRYWILYTYFTEVDVNRQSKKIEYRQQTGIKHLYLQCKYCLHFCKIGYFKKMPLFVCVIFKIICGWISYPAMWKYNVIVSYDTPHQIFLKS